MTTVRQQVQLVTLRRQLRPTTMASYMRLLGPILDETLPVGLDELLGCLPDNANTRRSTIIALRAVLDQPEVKAMRIPKAIPRRYELQSDDTYRFALMLSPHSARGLLMLDAGLRVGEACAITHKDLSGQWLTVDKQIQRINGVNKVTPVKGTVGRVGVPQGLVPVIQGLNETADPMCVRESLRRAGKKLGFTLNPHQLRHAYLTRLINVGTPLPIVQRQARHSDISVTLRTYYQAAQDEALDWVDRL